MENIVKNYSKRTTNILFIILFILLFFGFACVYKIWDLRKEKGSISDILRIKQDSLKLVKNKNGELVGRVETFEITIKELKENEQYILGENSNLKKKIGDLDNLVSYYKAQAIISGQGQGNLVVVPVEEAYIKPDNPAEVKLYKNIKWNSEFLDITGTVFDCEKYKFEYTYRLIFETYTYKKKLQEKRISRFFGRKSLVTDLNFADQNNLTPVSATSITIKPEKGVFKSGWFKFGAGFVAGFVSNSLIYGSYRE